MKSMSSKVRMIYSVLTGQKRGMGLEMKRVELGEEC
jgi:hypothetical protein